jgi:1,3-beta-glucan synthase
MSGHPQGHYDDGYGQQQHANDAYYQDEHQGYNDQYDYGQQQQQQQQQQHHGGEGYYDEGYVACEAAAVT